MIPDLRCPRCKQRNTLTVLRTLYGDYVWCTFSQADPDAWCAWFEAFHA